MVNRKYVGVICKHPGCNRKAHVRGYCRRHYNKHFGYEHYKPEADAQGGGLIFYDS